MSHASLPDQCGNYNDTLENPSEKRFTLHCKKISGETYGS